ncbi:MAG: hypothetical protein KDA41_19600, partial [Planctomycetales bacterium]|nr:hypothetical protein [Planctomycetales bacterium]
EQALLRYRTLAARFAVSGERLQIAGVEEGTETAAIITTADGAQWTVADVSEPLAAVSLVRVLSPEEEHLAPANDATRSLIRWLPLPTVRRAETTAPQAHLHRAPGEAND